MKRKDPTLIDGSVIVNVHETDGKSHIFATNDMGSARLMAEALQAAGCSVRIRQWSDGAPDKTRGRGYHEVRV